MDLYTTACVTILCIISTFSAQGIDDTGSHSNMGSNSELRCGNLSYISSRNSCCNDVLTHGLNQLVADCCKSVAYNPLNEICCNGSVFTRSSAHMTCNRGKDSEGQKGSHLTRSPIKPELKCGPNTYDPRTQLCCSGTLYRAAALNKCCGTFLYTPFDDHVLCCNGNLTFNVSKRSECVAGVIYTPENTNCNLSARPRLGEHCCGGKTFSPLTHICCNGHSHNKKNGNFCCGSSVYDHHNKFMKCCSGHLYNLNEDKVIPECCGNLLINKTNQICCSSSTHTILYDTKPNHHCCGHYHYNTSLWSCCAQHLKPTPSPNSFHAEDGLKPLMDLIPDICSKTVFFGKVESVALDECMRHIVLKVVNVVDDPWLNVSLDHCSSPALENGMTYLWEKINSTVHKPLSITFDLISDMHMFFTVCKHKCQKGG